MKSGLPRFLTRQADSMVKDVRMRMYAAGADPVTDTMDELTALIEYFSVCNI